MDQNFSQTSSLTKAIIIIEFVLVAYLLYSLTKNVYNSYLVDQYITSYETENSLLADENKKKNDDYLYFTSQEYIDKIAKQNLGLVNPGEEVIVITPESLKYNSIDDVLNPIQGSGASDIVRIETRSNPQLWWDFFFR